MAKRSLTIAAALIILVLSVGLAKYMAMKKADPTEQLFVQALNAKGLSVKSRTQDGRYVVDVHGQDLTVSLDNIRLNYERDHDPGAISRFVDTIVGTRLEVPEWKTAMSGLRFSAEPYDHDFGETVKEKVTDKVFKVLVYVDTEEKRITWINESQIKRWQVSKEEAVNAAEANMAKLMDETQIETKKIEKLSLSMFSTNSAFKASLIFSPNFKAKVQKEIGWPVFVVIPCRDFMYALPVKDKELLSRMGGVVVEEFKNSGYPITTEVLEISDNGIEAIGEYPAK